MSEGARPLVVVGMHRSGTSLAASFLEGLGVDVGRRLLEGDRNNRHGYFEDEEFLDLQRRALAACCPEGSEGWPDWGFTREGSLDRRRLDEFRPAAAALLRLSERRGPWGWKDPRTTLLLDFWDELLPDARYLAVFRHPAEVADSIRRVGGEVFRRNPSWALEAWSLYNRRLLAFARKHRDRVLVVESTAVPDDPAAVVLAIREKLGIELPTGEVAGSDPAACARVVAARIHDPEILVRHEESPAELPADARALWDELLASADVRNERTPRRFVRGLAPRDPGPSPAVSVVIPCHDDGRFLGDAVASALLSAGPAPEIVIVDDGSTDPDTLAALRLLSEAGFRVIRQENRGLGAARNTGIREARGRFLLPLDADNLLRPAYVPAAIEVLEREPKVGVVYGDAMYFGARRTRWSVGEFDVVRLAAGNTIDACAVFRREVWDQAGGYDERMARLGHQDWDLWLGAAERGWELRWVARPLFDYRVRPGSMTSHLFGGEVRRALWEHIVSKHRALYERHLPEILARHDLELQEAARRIEELASGSRPAGEALPDEAFRLEWKGAEIPGHAATGESFPVRVTVRNAGTRTWPDLRSIGGDGRFAVRLGFRWWRDEHAPVEGGRVELPRPIPPGETVTIEGRACAPADAGSYRLQLDMVQELVAWFESKGAPRLEAKVTVRN